MSTPISPKVTAGATWTTIATLALAFLNSVTPDMLGALGKWEPLVNGIVTLAAFGVGAYLKEDPLRSAGARPVPALDVADLIAKLGDILPNKSQAPFIPAALAKVADPAPAPEPVVVPEPTVPADAAPADPAPAA